jgi:hypothetical protein
MCCRRVMTDLPIRRLKGSIFLFFSPVFCAVWNLGVRGMGGQSCIMLHFLILVKQRVEDVFSQKNDCFSLFGDDAIWQLSRFLVNLAACSPRFYRFYDSIQKMNTEESRMDVARLFSQITESSTHGSSLVGLQTTGNRRSVI